MFQENERCRIGGDTAIDPMTRLEGKTATVVKIVEDPEVNPEMPHPYAVLELDEPVEDAFGKQWRFVNVETQYLESEF